MFLKSKYFLSSFSLILMVFLLSSCSVDYFKNFQGKISKNEPIEEEKESNFVQFDVQKTDEGNALLLSWQVRGDLAVREFVVYTDKGEELKKTKPLETDFKHENLLLSQEYCYKIGVIFDGGTGVDVSDKVCGQTDNFFVINLDDLRHYSKTQTGVWNKSTGILNVIEKGKNYEESLSVSVGSIQKGEKYRIRGEFESSPAKKIMVELKENGEPFTPYAEESFIWKGQKEVGLIASESSQNARLSFNFGYNKGEYIFKEGSSLIFERVLE